MSSENNWELELIIEVFDAEWVQQISAEGDAAERNPNMPTEELVHDSCS